MKPLILFSFIYFIIPSLFLIYFTSFTFPCSSRIFIERFKQCQAEFIQFYFDRNTIPSIFNVFPTWIEFRPQIFSYDSYVTNNGTNIQSSSLMAYPSFSFLISMVAMLLFNLSVFLCDSSYVYAKSYSLANKVQICFYIWPFFQQQPASSSYSSISSSLFPQFRSRRVS